MSHHPLDDALALELVGDGRYRGRTSDAYWNFAGPFGGYIAALLMKAVLGDARLLGPPVAQTVNYCAPLAKGEFEIAVVLSRSGKATQHWTVELQQGAVVAAAMPRVPAPDQVPSLQAPAHLPWLSAYDFKFVEGGPAFGSKPRQPRELGGSRTVLWMKDKPDRPLDYLALSALCDCFILRLVQMRGTLPPMSTVSMTSYFHATPDELAAQGTGHLLGIADAKRFNANFHDQSMELWGASGTLLASGAQTVWYRE